MGLGLRVRAGDEVDPVGGGGPGVPDLLAVDDEVSALAHRSGADGGDVGSGVGLGHADAPCRGAVEDLGQVGSLLVGGPELKEGGAHLAIGEP